MVRNTGIKGLENAVNITQIRGKHRTKFRLWSSSPSAPARKHSVIVKVTECFLAFWELFWIDLLGNRGVGIGLPLCLPLLRVSCVRLLIEFRRCPGAFSGSHGGLRMGCLSGCGCKHIEEKCPPA